VDHLSVTTHVSDGVAVVSAVGDVDLVSGPYLAEAVKEAVAGDGVTRVVVDLSGTGFLDSTGISVLLVGQRAALDNAVGFQIQAANGLVRQVLEMTGVWGYLSGEAPS